MSQVRILTGFKYITRENSEYLFNKREKFSYFQPKSQVNICENWVQTLYVKPITPLHYLKKKTTSFSYGKHNVLF